MNEVTKNEGKEIADATLFAGSETGFEGTTADTFKTPFVKILHKISPECEETDPKYIEGAKPGMFFNTATKEAVKELEIVVLKIRHHLMVWQPERKGLVGNFDKSLESKIVAKRQGVHKWDDEGNEIEDTISLFCQVPGDLTSLFVMPLSKSGLKGASSFCTRMRHLKTVNGKPVGVSWAGVWKIKTMLEKNDKGSWYSMASPEFIRFITAEEKNDAIMPALDMLKTAETNYHEENETTKVDESAQF